jgi:uroporphyrinogen-III decarboxylase
MVGTITDYCIELLGPVAMKAQFDFVYIFEDCCGANGPLFSPAIYKSLFDRHYQKLIRFYKDVCKIPFALVDSDGVADELVPLWIESGFDIIFPVEVGKWNGSPDKLRKTYGNGFGMLGGVDKHLITIGGQTLRDHLTGLIPAVKSGRYLPIPDHRIPPEVSLEKFMEYIEIFKEVFDEVK